MERRHDLAEFAAMLAGVDDVTVEEQVVARDVDSVLTQIFEEMARRFLPQRAGGRSAVVQYDIALRDGSVRTWQVSVAGGACTVRAGTGSPAQVTVQMALPRFLRLLSGSLDPVAAFMSGDLRVRGDLVLAQLMQGWFDRT
jgi:putative sterol carrier protein